MGEWKNQNTSIRRLLNFLIIYYYETTLRDLFKRAVLIVCQITHDWLDFDLKFDLTQNQLKSNE